MAAQAAPVDRPRHPPCHHSSFLDHGTRLQSHTAAGQKITLFIDVYILNQVEIMFLWGTRLIPPDRLKQLWEGF